jgi:hypothetical protein
MLHEPQIGDSAEDRIRSLPVWSGEIEVSP